MGDRLITVFGGTGFLGRAIVHRLLEAGARVRVAARSPRFPPPAEFEESLEECQADIRNPDAVARAVHGADGVVNAVSLYAERADLTFQDIHVEGAGVLARGVRDAGVERLVHVSGIGVDEDSSSAYVRARARGERRVREICPEAVVLRPSVLFGPGDAFLAALRSVTLAPLVPLFGKGGTRLQPVFVDDVARAVERSLEDPAAPGRIFELGGAEVLTYREAVKAVLAHLGRRRLLLPVPFPAWRVLAGAASVLPGPPLTRDQVVLMQSDNMVSGELPTFADLGLEPTGFRSALPDCLPR
jgi:NADH dehydrogenase